MLFTLVNLINRPAPFSKKEFPFTLPNCRQRKRAFLFCPILLFLIVLFFSYMPFGFFLIRTNLTNRR